MTDATPTARQRAQAVMRELNERMKSPRGDYYQGDLRDPHLSVSIVERHLAAHAAQAVAEIHTLVIAMCKDHHVDMSEDEYMLDSMRALLAALRAGQPGQEPTNARP